MGEFDFHCFCAVISCEIPVRVLPLAGKLKREKTMNPFGNSLNGLAIQNLNRRRLIIESPVVQWSCGYSVHLCFNANPTAILIWFKGLVVDLSHFCVSCILQLHVLTIRMSFWSSLKAITTWDTASQNQAHLKQGFREFENTRIKCPCCHSHHFNCSNEQAEMLLNFLTPF